MIKCIKCGNEAKWKSPIYVSPLCDTCAKQYIEEIKGIKEVDIDDHFLHICEEIDGTRLKAIYRRKEVETGETN